MEVLSRRWRSHSDFVFDGRVEIISPGHLPNNLTVANIRSGNSNIRNPILTSFATKVLSFRGLGTGILRALREYPGIDFVDDPDGNLFRAFLPKRVFSRFPRQRLCRFDEAARFNLCAK
jgi:ATP-dependent DNA helicase RecG